MVIKRLIVKNFRNVKEADIELGEHILLVGPNNVGKSTILEAINLAIGPDRLNSPDAINENDFYKKQYLDEESKPIKIEIECHLVGLNKKQLRLFGEQMESWDTQDSRYVSFDSLPDERDESRFPLDCLRVKFEGYYDEEEDEFAAKTFYPKTKVAEDEEPTLLKKNEKREIGYLYLRFLRTGSRALSLERGSLMDIILRIQEIRPTSWQSILDGVKGVGEKLNAEDGFKEVLQKIESKVSKYTPLSQAEDESLKFEVTNLTRRELKRVMNLFVGTEPSNFAVPYQNVGSGTTNIFLFTLMILIAELKKEKDKNVIFAMEEPEVALPPYTQRRIVDEIFTVSNQSFTTSHSPYVGEQFIDRDILVLENSGDKLDAHLVDTQIFRRKKVKRDFRIRFAEGLLSKGVILVEGISDLWVMYEVANKLNVFCNDYCHLDTIGLVIVENEGGGSINKLAEFFKAANIKTYTIHDSNTTVQDELFDISTTISQDGIERLLVDEILEDKLTDFLQEAQSYSDFPKYLSGNNGDAKTTVFEVLKERKGQGYAVSLVSMVENEDGLPQTLVNFLKEVNDHISQ